MAETDDTQAQLSGLPEPGVGVRQFAVGDELVVVAPEPSASAQEPRGSRDQQDSNAAFSINSSGRLIWEMCDGKHTPKDIVDTLAAQFDAPYDVLEGEVRRSLTHYSRLGILQGLYEHARAKSAVLFAFGIEDCPAYWWQTAILLESLAEKLPSGWVTHVVVCNGGEPLSPRLRHILSRYQTRHSTTIKPSSTFPSDPTRGADEAGRIALKVEALAVLGPDLPPEAMLCLIDCDCFLYGDFPIGLVPRTDAVTQLALLSGYSVKLDKVAEALSLKSDFLPGGGPIFLTATVAKNEGFIEDCRRLARALVDLDSSAAGRSALSCEPPAFALAMALNAVDYSVVDNVQFVRADRDAPTITTDTLYKYGGDDRADSSPAFFKSTWRMDAYEDRDFLKTDFGQFAKKAISDHEHFFYKLAHDARSRLDV